MNKNYECVVDNLKSNHDIFKRCAKHVKDVKFIKQLGSGTNGKVYLSEVRVPGLSKPITVAVKKIEKEAEYPGELEDFIRDFNLEVEYSYLMSEANIGPKMHDAFYAVEDGGSTMVQYIVMAVGDGSIDNLLLKPNSHSIAIKQAAVRRMMRMIEKQVVDTNMYCNDIKPGNFVYKIVPLGGMKSSVNVKMIDFGSDFCKLNRVPRSIVSMARRKEQQDHMYITIMYIQLYMIINHYVEKEGVDSEILEPFYTDKIMDSFFDKLINKPSIVQKILHKILTTDDDHGEIGFMLSWYAMMQGKAGIKPEIVEKRIMDVMTRNYLEYFKNSENKMDLSE